MFEESFPLFGFILSFSIKLKRKMNASLATFVKENGLEESSRCRNRKGSLLYCIFFGKKAHVYNLINRTIESKLFKIRFIFSSKWTKNLFLTHVLFIVKILNLRIFFYFFFVSPFHFYIFFFAIVLMSFYFVSVK